MRKLVILLLLLALPLAAQTKRQRAFLLFDDNKLVEALPLLEELATENPKDGQVMLKLGFCRLVQSNTLTDPEARKKGRARAREALETAQRLGVQDSLLTAALASLAPDGGEETKFSEVPAAEAAMRRAEADFSAGRYPEARAGYQKALELDPRLYEAAVFLGQCYRLEGNASGAEEWCARAVAIDPTRETAYRYWGTSLLAQGKSSEALDKFIQAYLSEPYGRLSRNGLIDYARKNGLKLSHPKVTIPTEVEGDTIKITPDAGPAWLAYALAHTEWKASKWAEKHPGTAYRPSVEEEADAIRTALQVARESNIPLDPTLTTLQKLDQKGLLEAYILLGMPGEGIVDDYAAYAAAHRDLLERYVREVVLKGGAV